MCIRDRAYIEQRLVAEMQALLEVYGASDFELRAVPAQDSDADPTLVLLPYRSIYANIEYVESQIRIEFSCRSMKEPRERIEICLLYTSGMSCRRYTHIYTRASRDRIRCTTSGCWKG